MVKLVKAHISFKRNVNLRILKNRKTEIYVSLSGAVKDNLTFEGKF